jgi:hypothetical protein
MEINIKVSTILLHPITYLSPDTSILPSKLHVGFQYTDNLPYLHFVCDAINLASVVNMVLPKSKWRIPLIME